MLHTVPTRTGHSCVLVETIYKEDATALNHTRTDTRAQINDHYIL